MAKNQNVQDLRPVGGIAEDIKAKNQIVQDVRLTGNTLLEDFGTERFYTVVFQAGQSMGLLLALTYTTAGTVDSSKSP